MKVLFSLLLLTATSLVTAKVAQPEDQDLSHELSFSVEAESEKARQIASEEDESSVEQSEDTDRNIASDVVESEDSKMQYWKY